MAQTILELKNVKKSFGGHEVHKGVTFTLNKGETIGLLGASGTGKSVLLRSIIGLEFIDEGKILFEGQEIQDLSETDYFKVRLQLSYSFQSGALFDSLTVYQNLAFPLVEHTDLSSEEINDRILEMLKLIDLKGKEHLLPAELSGGMQKRVGMARSIILNPKVVLYDEPTAGLDPSNTLNIINLMKRLKEREITGIFVTHDIPAAFKVCDRILILFDGQIAINDTPENLLHSSNPIVKRFLV